MTDGMQKVHDFLKKAGTYYLATMEGEKPRVRPFGTIDCFEERLYFQTGKVKDVAKQMEANQWVELCAFVDGAWLRVSARAVMDDRLEPKKHMLDAYPSLRRMYDENDGNTAVYYLADAEAVFSSFTAAPEKVTF